MSAPALLEAIHRAGGTVSTDGVYLHLKAPKALPDDLLTDLKTYKTELIEALRGSSSRHPQSDTEAEDLRDHFEERAQASWSTTPGCQGLRPSSKRHASR